ncbi:hypothetical protein IC229_28535 [Spirosoma sp. BT702]|uniref:Uncharacterized protein n=1 Tax=Spirosoma profusum TaxID=2771354 RepID=A0A926Y118_9BACT|nr:hypothetical protein [Spirosoma profusum]MBD2704618.1 hypothetical protein [Spirosoma profusum]
MNRRITPDDLDTSPYKELIQSLVLQWMHAELPAQGMTYGDFTTAIRILLLTTQNPDRTSELVTAVLDQATAFHKTSAWVDQELKFEGMVHGADRTDFLKFELSQAASIDDALLDSYNERINRFPQHD